MLTEPLARAVKYIHKGPDYVDYRFVDGAEDDRPESFEEAAQISADAYIKGRYLSATEAFWRISGYELTIKEPSVARLGVHTQGQNRAQFNGRGVPRSSASTLIRYFLRPAEFADLRYVEYFEQTVARSATAEQLRQDNPQALPEGCYLEQSHPDQNFKPQVISRRQRRVKIARVKAVRPGSGEEFYIRQLLLHKPASGFRDLRTTGQGTPARMTHPTFQAAATFLGLFEDQDEASLALQEAIDLRQEPRSLRHLFCLLIIDGAPAQRLWDDNRRALSADFVPRGTAAPSEQELAMADNAAMASIAETLYRLGTSPVEYGLRLMDNDRPEEVAAELAAFLSRRHVFRDRCDQARERFNPEQRELYNKALRMIENPGEERLLLIQGRAGRGKTFVIHAVIDRMRSLGQVVAVSGATGLSAAAFERGATVHRMFGIPVLDADEDEGTPLTSTLTPQSRRMEYLRAARAIVIDEIWALNRAVIEAVDAVLQVATGIQEPFGGKVVIAIGDPRQTAPIVPGGGRPDVLEQSFRATAVFRLFNKQELQTPMRNAGDPEFASWVDRVGDDHTSADVDVSQMFRVTDSIDEARRFLFPPEIVEDPDAASNRAFLTPYNRDVDAFNKTVLESLSGASQEFLSFDSVKGDVEPGQEPLTSPELLNELGGPGIPPHALSLKVGSLCVIMRNLAPFDGLVKNAKVAVTAIRPRVVLVRLLSSAVEFCLPRITFEFQPKRFPFRVIRKQVPLRLAYALTFHGCQGATLLRTVIDCRLPIFSHGQRYACVSRGRNRRDSVALLAGRDDDNPSPHMVNNIVYREFVEA